MTEAGVTYLAIDDMLHVGTYRDVRAVLNARQSRQALHRDAALTGEVGTGPTDAFVGGTVISLHGPEHARRRRLEAALFGREQRLHVERHVLLPALRRSLSAAATGPADLMDLVRLALARVSCHLVGVEPAADGHMAGRVRTMAEDIVAAIGADWSTGDRDALLRAGIDAREAFRAELYEPALRRTPDAGGRDPGGLLSLLAGAGDDGPTGEAAFREAVLFLVASSTTTTNAVPHAVMHLERWFAGRPDRRGLLAGTAFCRRAACETLRLHPPIPALLRRAEDAVDLPGGGRIEAGTYVALDLAAASQDPEAYGADAGRFDPERDVPAGVLPYGFAFGGGPHMCMGRALALGDVAADGDEEAPQGILTVLLHELYRAGVTVDRSRRVRRRPQTAKDEYLRVPVRFGPVR